MRVRVLYFAVVRERLGRDEETLELAAGADVAAAWHDLERRHPDLAALRPVVKLAVNEEFAGGERVLADGDVIALIPPVAGGAGVSGQRRSCDPNNPTTAGARFAGSQDLVGLLVTTSTSPKTAFSVSTATAPVPAVSRLRPPARSRS